MHKLSTILIGLGVVLVGVSAASASGRPGFQTLRYEEDWSFLAQVPKEEQQPLDALKYIPLGSNDSFWLSLGGQARLRFENWSNFVFSPAAANDDDYWLVRLRAHADLHLGDYLRLFVEGKSAHAPERTLPGGRRTLDVDELAAQNAFVELRLPGDGAVNWMLRSGRQELLMGKQRLISPLDWANTRRTFDGFLGQFAIENWTIKAFWTLPVTINKYDLNKIDDDSEFFGVYKTGTFTSIPLDMDAYLLGLHRESATFNAKAGYEKRYTVGLRFAGKIGQSPWAYDVEGAYQFGDIAGADISAYMLASRLDYAFQDLAGNPKAHLGFDYASGDEGAGGDVETFNQLFPLGHAYLGYMDFIGRQNIVDLTGGLSVAPHKQVTVAMTGHYFWRAHQDDALYNAGGGVVRAGSAGSSQEVGSEIDLTVKASLHKHLSAVAGYSHFFAGDFIKESGTAEDADFVHVTLQVTF